MIPTTKQRLTLLLACLSVSHKSSEAFSVLPSGAASIARRVSWTPSTAAAAPPPPKDYFHVTVPREREPSRLWATTDKNDEIDSFVAPTSNKVETSLEAVDHDHWTTTQAKPKNPTPVVIAAAKTLASFFQNDISKDSKALAALAVMAFALMITPLDANAAMSGGRMGGSFNTSPSSSVIRTMPRASYGGSSSYYRSGFARGFGSGLGAGVLAAPRYSYGITPFFSPFQPVSPFGYYGGPGVITYSRGPGLFPLLIAGGVLWAATSAMRQTTEDLWSSSSSSDFDSFFATTTESSALGPGVSVAKLSVAMSVPNRDDPNSILGVLNRLSRMAKTDSRVGIQNLTSQVALELLRRKSSMVSASAEYKHFNDRSRAYREYNGMSVKERGKFESETVSRYGGVDYAVGTPSYDDTGATSSAKATMAVVTILLTIDGDSTKIPTVRGIGDVEAALRQIASDAKVDDCLQSAEILWTPEDRTETLTPRDVIADYPGLRSI